MSRNRCSPRASARHRVSLIGKLIAVTAGALFIWLGVINLNEWMLGPEASLAKHVANAVGIVVLAVPLVMGVRRLLDRRPVSRLGFSTHHTAWREVLYGGATWLLPAAVGVMACVAFGWLEMRLGSSPLEVVGAVVLLVVLVFVYEAFPEELIFRGYLYRNLVSIVVPWAAILGQAVLFTVWGTALWVIQDGWGVLLERSVLFLAMGVVLGCIRLISGSLWATIGFHLAFQVSMQIVVGRYADIEVNDEWIFTLATAVLAFAAASTVAGLLWPGQHNWTKREPDVDEPPASERRRRPA